MYIMCYVVENSALYNGTLVRVVCYMYKCALLRLNSFDSYYYYYYYYYYFMPLGVKILRA